MSSRLNVPQSSWKHYFPRHYALPTLPIELNKVLAQIEAGYIHEALVMCNWNQTEAAKLLCIKRTTLIEKLRRHAMSYQITRVYQDSKLYSRVIKKGLTLSQAQRWCKDKETSSKTCKSADNIRHTEMHGSWFDAYEEE